MVNPKNKLIALTTTLVFIAGLLVFVPPVAAQTALCPGQTPVGSQLNVAVEDKSGGLVRPITGEGKIEATITLTVDQGGKSISPMILTIQESTDKSWATVVLSQYSAAVKVPDNGGEIPVKVTGTVYLTRDAPAFSTANIVIKASSTGGTCVQPPKEAEGKTSVKAGFYGKMQARLEKTIDGAGQNSKVTIPLIVENFGNGEILTKYKLENAEKTKVDVILPGNIIVPTAIGTSLDPKQILPIDIQTPYKNGYMNDVAPVVITITSESSEDPEIKGQDATVTALIRTQGVYVPGFELTTLMAAALAALVGFVRRR